MADAAIIPVALRPDAVHRNGCRLICVMPALTAPSRKEAGLLLCEATRDAREGVRFAQQQSPPAGKMQPAPRHYSLPGFVVSTSNDAWTGFSTTISAVTVFTSGGRSMRKGYIASGDPCGSGFAIQYLAFSSRSRTARRFFDLKADARR